MGKAVKSIGSVFGLNAGGGPGPKLDRSAFDISSQAKKYEDALTAEKQFNSQQNRALSEALAQQATGQGPLAGAAMRQAANRSLAQTLSAAQAAGGSPLATRNLIQARGQSARDLAELGLQEQMQAQQALGSQLARAAETGRADITTGFGIAKSPQELMADYEKIRFQGDLARRQAVQQQQNQMFGSVLDAASKLGAAALGKAAHGAIIPGKPAKKDSLANDTVPVLTSPGEMVVPASVVQQGPKEIKKFAEALLEKNKTSNAGGFGSVLAAQAELNRKNKKVKGK